MREHEELRVRAHIQRPPPSSRQDGLTPWDLCRHTSWWLRRCSRNRNAAASEHASPLAVRDARIPGVDGTLEERASFDYSTVQTAARCWAHAGARAVVPSQDTSVTTTHINRATASARRYQCQPDEKVSSFSTSCRAGGT
ncbi:hypothetical protein AGIG_G11239 [Arapaima gigas]